MANAETASDVVAGRIRELRRKRGLRVTDLGARCAELGAPGLTAQALYKLEGQRGRDDRPPRPVTVDELLALALALNVAPVHLLVPPDDYQAPYPVTATLASPAHKVRGWVRGLFVRPDAEIRPVLGPGGELAGLDIGRLPRAVDVRDFWSEVPPAEFEARQHGQCPVCGGRAPRDLTGASRG